MNDDVLVVGAGVSGLALARQLVRNGAGSIRIVEKSRGVGGRCATRRAEGAIVDHGVPLLHGASSAFRAELAALPDVTLLPDWPFRVRGTGVPCQPQAYRSHSSRAAVAEGVNAFPKHLARGLEIHRETAVSSLSLDQGRIVAATGAGSMSARTVIVTCPVDQARALLAPLAKTHDELRSVLAVLSGVFTLPSLTVIAGYERERDDSWHIQLPGPGSILHTVINDSSKRSGGPLVLVLQAGAAFSRAHLEDNPTSWAPEILDAAAVVLGSWARTPQWQQHHRWRYARVQRGFELAHPILLTLPGGARVGFCGEAFHPEGGVEGAFLSGLELSQRLLSQPS